MTTMHLNFAARDDARTHRLQARHSLRRIATTVLFFAGMLLAVIVVVAIRVYPYLPPLR